MPDELVQHSSELSPERRALLQQVLAQDGNAFNVFPLSFAQQRLWVLDQFDPASRSAYLVPLAVRLTGTIDLSAFEAALHGIVQRHEVLRTTFQLLGDAPVQRIAPAAVLPMPLLDLGELPADHRETEVLRLAGEDALHPFDLTRGPLVRVRVLRLAPAEHVLLMTLHHIVCDGWSLGVLIRELAILYEAFAAGKPSPLPPLPIQYADFAAWQRQWLQTGGAMELQLEYWKRQLAGLLPLRLPPDRSPPAEPSFCCVKHPVTLTAAFVETLRAVGRQEGVTLFIFFAAALKILLHWYTRQTDIVIGADIANRNRVEVEGLIGFFVNLVALRTRLNRGMTCRELLSRVRTVALDAYAHQDLPFDRLVDDLQPERRLQAAPLFQVVIVLQNAPSTALALDGLTFTPLDVAVEYAKFDLVLNLVETPVGVTGGFKYNADLFNPETIARLAAQFETILQQMVLQPNRSLGALGDLLSESDHDSQSQKLASRRQARQQKFKGARRKAAGSF